MINSATTFAGVITPTASALDLLGNVMKESGIGQPAKVAEVLVDLAPVVENQGDRGIDLAGRLREASQRLRAKGYNRADWPRTQTYKDLRKIAATLQAGHSLSEALRGGTAFEEDEAAPLRIEGGRRLAPRPILRETVGPLPTIHWDKYGNERYPPPLAPEGDLGTAGRYFAYAFHTVASYAGHGVGDDKAAIEGFFGISREFHNRIERGTAVPPQIGNFPTDRISVMLMKSKEISPHYELLLRHLLILSMFEAYGWNLGEPLPEAPWDVDFLYSLRVYACTLLLTPRGRDEFEEDTALRKVVERRASLEDVSWYPRGKTRRDVFENWIQGITGEKRAGAAQDARALMVAAAIGEGARKKLGEKILATTGIKPPISGATWRRQIQWAFQQWTCLHWYGALPAWGLLFTTGRLRSLFWSTPDQLRVRLKPSVAHGMISMMSLSGFLDASTQIYLTGLIPKEDGGEG